MFGDEGRLFLSDAAIDLGVSKDKILETINDEIKVERKVRFMPTDAIIIHLKTTEICNPTITWSTSEVDISTASLMPISNLTEIYRKELDEESQIKFPIQVTPYLSYKTPKVTQDFPFTQEDFNDFASNYNKKHPNTIVLETMLNVVRKNCPTYAPAKVKQMARISLRYVLDHLDKRTET